MKKQRNRTFSENIKRLQTEKKVLSYSGYLIMEGKGA